MQLSVNCDVVLDIKGMRYCASCLVDCRLRKTQLSSLKKCKLKKIALNCDIVMTTRTFL